MLMQTKSLFFIFVFISALCLPASYVFSQGAWTKKADFPTSSRFFAVSFSIGNKGYYGLGQKQTEPFVYKVYNDWWEYDPAKDSWVQKADFPGSGRLGAKGFSLNGKGYAGAGYFIMPNGPNAGGNDYQSDIYEYDPSSNTWVKKNDCFLGDKDFLFVRSDTIWCVNPEYRTLRKYNPLTDTWAETSWGKKVFAPDYSAIAGNDAHFTINGNKYLITLVKKKRVYINQLWEFNPHSLAWTQKNNLPLPGTGEIAAFVIGEKVFVMRCGQDFLEYNSALDAWTEVKNINLPDKYFFPAFVVSGKYYGFSKYKFWEFVP